MRAHQRLKLLAHALQRAEPVVLGQRLHETLDGVCGFVAAGLGRLEELLHDLGAVRRGEGGGAQDGGEVGVGLEGAQKGVEGAGGGIQGGGFGGGGVLFLGVLSE